MRDFPALSTADNYFFFVKLEIPLVSWSTFRPASLKKRHISGFRYRTWYVLKFVTLRYFFVNIYHFFQSSIESELSHLLNSSSLSPMQAAKITSCLAGFPAVTDQLRSVLEAGMASTTLV